MSNVTSTSSGNAVPAIQLGLGPNLAQFSLLVVVNAFVGAMVGLERTILPAIAEQEFHLAARAAVLSFIVVFGVAKALTNYFAGRLSDSFGRKAVLVSGWFVAIPVPFLLMWAPSWNWVLVANVLLGVSQGLTWSTTVIMKIDLAGPAASRARDGPQRVRRLRRGGRCPHSRPATSRRTTGCGPSRSTWASRSSLVGLLLSASAGPRDSRATRAMRRSNHGSRSRRRCSPSARSSVRTSLPRPRTSRSISQAGLVNNLNDGMAWGLFPLFFAARGAVARTHRRGSPPSTRRVWGVGQLFTGALSDRVGRKWLIASGMWIQAIGIAVIVALGEASAVSRRAPRCSGSGTAMVYPTLLAAIGDVAHPVWRASAVGVYRLWRDLGYAVGALVAGFTADALGIHAAIWLIAAVTFASGLVVAVRMKETLRMTAPRSGGALAPNATGSTSPLGKKS